jgi:hypothetical protein
VPFVALSSSVHGRGIVRFDADAGKAPNAAAGAPGVGAI